MPCQSTFEAVANASSKVLWPQYARSAIVVAVEHPEDKPELDWWQKGLKGGTPGNQMLITIISRLIEWLGKETGCEAQNLAPSRFQILD